MLMAYAKPLIVSVVVSALCTWLWIRLAHKLNVMDVPGQRRLHSRPVPRAGGLALLIAMLSGLMFFDHQDYGLAFIAGLLATSLVGLLDDLRLISSRTKFLGQTVSLTLVVTLIPELSVAYKIIFILAGLVSINFWNFMDGSNGMIATQALIGAGLLFVFLPSDANPTLSLIALCLVGASAGFLPFNIGRARVFLGDVGSHLLGFVVIYLAYMAGVHEKANFAFILLASTLPIWMDAAMTLFLRILKGRNIFKAHREHLYQWLIRFKLSHLSVMVLYGGISVIAGLSAYVYGAAALLSACAIFAILYWVLKWQIYSRI
jgi:UDP-N-acetylmuramyl pentapeptide phosphotransferase/UDP-N-acetylglucosamine-1-phosphate transferase